jgi:hypothetical protein
VLPGAAPATGPRNQATSNWTLRFNHACMRPSIFRPCHFRPRHRPTSRPAKQLRRRPGCIGKKRLPSQERRLNSACSIRRQRITRIFHFDGDGDGPGLRSPGARASSVPATGWSRCLLRVPDSRPPRQRSRQNPRWFGIHSNIVASDVKLCKEVQSTTAVPGNHRLRHATIRRAKGGCGRGSPNRGPTDRPCVSSKIVYFRQEYRFLAKSRFDSGNRSFLLGWARPVRAAHLPFPAWVSLTWVRNGVWLKWGRWRQPKRVRAVAEVPEVCQTQARSGLVRTRLVGATSAPSGHAPKRGGDCHLGRLRPRRIPLRKPLLSGH